MKDNEFTAGDRVFVFIDGNRLVGDITGFDDTNGNYIVTFEDGTKESISLDNLMYYDADVSQMKKPEDGKDKVVDKVLNDIKERSEIGCKKYGHYLETFNGRSSIQDAYEESLDQSMYLKQKVLEVKELKSKLDSIIINAVNNNGFISNEDICYLSWIKDHIDGR